MATSERKDYLGLRKEVAKLLGRELHPVEKDVLTETIVEYWIKNDLPALVMNHQMAQMSSLDPLFASFAEKFRQGHQEVNEFSDILARVCSLNFHLCKHTYEKCQINVFSPFCNRWDVSGLHIRTIHGTIPSNLQLPRTCKGIFLKRKRNCLCNKFKECRFFYSLFTLFLPDLFCLFM